MAEQTQNEAPAPAMEAESSSTPAPATQQLDDSTIEETKAELVRAQGQSLQQHHQARDVIGMIRSISRNIPQNFAPMVNAAAAPTLNAQEAQMKAAEDDLVQLMLRTREMARRMKGVEQAAETDVGSTTVADEAEGSGGTQT